MIFSRLTKTARKAARWGAVASLALATPAQAGGLTASTLAAMANPATAPSSTATGTSALTSSSALSTGQATQVQAVQTANDLAAAARAITSMQAAQAAAQSAAVAGANNLGLDPVHPGQALPNVADGLQVGGLVPDSGIAAPGVANPVTSWTGASTPVQSVSAGKTTVTIQQTQANAILNWTTFNIGKNTTLTFNQSAGDVALNRVTDPSGSPSQILGALSGAGQVYVINQNGIIFGGSSQVNVGALIASAANITDTQFTTNGIYSTKSGTSYNPSFTNAGGAVTVQAGAQIATLAPGSVTTGGGFVLLLGTNVSNQGAISTPDGQTELAAGDNFLLRPGYSTTANEASTTRGNEVAAQLNKAGSSLTGGSGTVSNSGMIIADTGDITLDGESVAQTGVLLSTTSVSVRGTIHLLTSASDPYGNVTLGNGSLTMIEPELDSNATALDSQRAALIAQSATETQVASPGFDDLSLLSDQEEESRVEIVSGNNVEFQGSSLTMAQGGQVAVSAVNRIQTDSGAVIDVAGTDIALPVSANDITVNIQGFEQRDDTQNRLTGNLNSNTVYVDDRDLSVVAAGTDGYTTARDYTDGGVLEVSGYLATTGHEIGEWTAAGGTITLQTGSAGAVVAQSGSVFNMDGGAIQYQAGLVKQSYLLGENGQVYNVNTAPAYITYAGVYNGFLEDHAAWGIGRVYTNALVDPSSVEEAGYTEGRDAGTLTLDSPTTLFAGTIDASVVNGSEQTSAAPSGVTDPYLLAQNVVAEPGALVLETVTGNNASPGTANIAFTDSTGTADAADSLAVDSSIPTALTGTSDFNAAAISQANLGGLDVLTEGSVGVTAPLTLAGGANVSLYGSAVTISAGITAPTGTVSAGNIDEASKTELADPVTSVTGDVVLANGATIDTSGIWTNMSAAPAGPDDAAFANGGAVSLVSATNLQLDTGSAIDASAGAVIAQNGARTGGAGGNITLSLVNLDSALPETGNLLLDGTLQSTGFTAGGALTLNAPNIRIGAFPATEDAATVTLQPDFFDAGFSSYTLNGQISIAPGTSIDVLEPTEQFTNTAGQVLTGGDVSAGATFTLLPLYTANTQLTSISQRPGASLTLNSTASLGLPEGASITVDPKQAITLTGDGQMTIDGDLTAPGGAISITDNATLTSVTPVTTYANGQIISVWLGSTAVLTTAATPFIASNAAGYSIAVAPSGGSIDITGNQAVIITQAGAVLNAAGSSASELPAAEIKFGPAQGAVQPIALAGAGGSIALESQNGLFLYGNMLAPAGGASAAGGSLSLTLDTDGLLNAQNLPDAARILTITQADTAPALPTNLAPGVADAALAQGTGQISVAQIDAGGFGALTFSANDAIMFQGDVTLTAAQSITLAQGRIAESASDGSVVLAAPYVELIGNTPINAANSATIYEQAVTGYSLPNSSGAFTVQAGLIDLKNAVGFGGIETETVGTGTVTQNLNGFADVNLDSSGDMRFLAGTVATGGAAAPTTLISTGNVNLSASVIYSTAANGYTASVLAGYDPKLTGATGSFLPTGVLTISQPAGNNPVAPDDIQGGLGFYAATIEDSGAVWNPLGSITFGSVGPVNNVLPANLFGVSVTGDPEATIALLPGSFTSVSAAGLTIPYGGTTDGVTYDVNGNAVAIGNTTAYGLNAVSVANGQSIQSGTITLGGQQISVAQGATLDLNGGGNLAGEGFISGEGGSTDVLVSPLLQVGASGGVTQPSLSTNQVYAIVAGAQPDVAPVQDNTATGTTGSVPAVGEQIIIPAGVPGLPAGRYTLLPASYALTQGGYRVEFDGAANLAAASVMALPNGSYVVAGQTGIANTNVESSLPIGFTITPAATVQNYADYDTESYSTFLVADAAKFGANRPQLPEDAGRLVLNIPALDTAELSDAGTTTFVPASGGIGGTVQINAIGGLAITGATAPNPQAGTAALSAEAIDAFDPQILQIKAAGITLDSGATVTAARVILTSTSGGSGITLQGGSEINTIGQGILPFDSSNVGPYTNSSGGSILDVGNGYITYTNTNGANGGPITIADGATVYTDGSLTISTSSAVNIGTDANYGAAYLDLSVPEINVGDPASVGIASASGLTLTPAVLQRLTGGVPSAGVPATQILVLSASQSLNFFGTTGLDLSGSNVQLVIDSPAIYGYGKAGDVATISAGTIVWNGELASGASVAPGEVLANEAGTGTLDFDANTIIFGYSSLDEPARDVPLSRLTLGFSTVNLNATDEIIANNQGSLSVYQSQAQYGAAGTGGVLNLNTPLLTGADEASMSFTAGGALNLAAPAGAAPATNLAANAAGAEIDLTAASENIDSAVILPSGKLDLQSTGSITLGAASNLNLAGDVSNVLGTTTYGTGGSLVAESATGNITQAAGAVIDVSAAGSNAGSVALTAEAGTVALDGTLSGSAPNADTSGSFTLRTQTIPDFTALNNALDNGGVFGTRSFEIEQGDLTIGNGVEAQNVSVSVDSGSLTVDGTIDASFGGAGSISLAAGNNLTLAPGAVLAAEGKVLQTDSYGVPVNAANTPEISLTTTNGALTLQSGATINMASADGVARGDLELNVPRLGGNTAGDADISTQAGLNINGAATIAVNAFATYHGLPDTTDTSDALITQAYLDQINTTDTLPFMEAAATNADLASRMSGLTAYDSVLHFRPGVEITSATADGDLTVQGDLDLSAYRYSDPAGYGQQVNAASYGSGEPGVVVIRAGGNLNVYGSITDGFSQPVSDTGTSYASGWVLYAGAAPNGESTIVPVSVTLAAGSAVAKEGSSLNYAVPVSAGVFQSGAVAPVALTLAGAVQTTSTAFIATSNITRAGVTLFTPGQLVPAGTKLLPGTIIAAGGTFPFTLNIAAMVWPANTPITIASSNNKTPLTGGVVVLSQNLTLAPGSVISGNSYISFASGASSVSTRTAAGGTQGQIYPLGQLLPEGDLSWSIHLVSGANTAAADTGAVQAASALAAAGDTGNLTLADAHYGPGEVAAFSVIRTGTGALSLTSGGSVTEESDYGIYTAGAESPGVTSAYNLPQGLEANGTLLGSSYTSLAQQLAAGYQANYPDGGGNVLLSAQGNLNGFAGTNQTDALGDWLWLQGGANQAAAWWVEFGALEPSGGLPQLDGFQGIGTLGGGNLTVNVGGNASNLNLAIASTGRVLADGTLLQTGGGNLTTNVGEAINFGALTTSNGQIADLRGNTMLTAGSIGTIVPVYQGDDAQGDDPRAEASLQTELATVGGGINLAPGDGTVTVDTRGDLVVNNVENPGIQSAQTDNTLQADTTSVAFTTNGQTIDTSGGGETIFSLWSNATSVALNSTGGDVSPYGNPTNSTLTNYFPPSLSAVAQNGNIDFIGGTVELAPAPDGTLDLLAADSIYGFTVPNAAAGADSTTISMSGADQDVEATPFDPLIRVTNPSTGAFEYSNDVQENGLVLVAFGPDTPTADLHQDGQAPADILAGTDIVGLNIGQIMQGGSGGTTQYIAAMPFDVAAGRDIVASGLPGLPGLFLNLGPNDVTSVSAGRDILESSFDIAGPGTLLVQAGRNIYEPGTSGENGTGSVLESVGPLFDINPNNRDGGSNITVIAGTGATGPDYTGFENSYLDPDSTLSLQDAAAIISENDATLLSYLQTNYGYTGSAAGAYARFKQLKPSQQDLFLLTVYFNMLNQSGLEFNEPNSVRYKSYALGRDVIAALFPTTGADGQPITYAGDITLFGASGIHTDFGGAIQTLTPGGETIIGVEGATPPGSAGFITQGTGDIDIYAQNSVLLGESRVLTTFGGNVLVWSAEGDINAGRGAKTTVVYAPVQRVYDNYGNVSLSPSVPSTGAGIGTLNPIPQVQPGNINLVAPVGTVDAGEAGIRVSGNLNIAAAHVLNAANIEVQGTTTGVPTVAAPDIGGLSSANNAAGAAAAAAAAAAAHPAPSDQPSIFLVEVLGYGGGNGASNPVQQPRERKNSATQTSYDYASPFQVLGVGPMSAAQIRQVASAMRPELK